jgi:dethiobiotin synthetase
VFIIGTDTGVGKTVIAAGLALAARRRRIRVGVMKPVATGCFVQEGQLLSEDTLFLLEAIRSKDHTNANPIRFRNPLAPLAAARAESRAIDTSEILRSYEDLRENFQFMIVEGIGGLMVPVTENYFVFDMVKEFDLDVILVSRTQLGTINHTLLTIQVARSKQLKVKGVIFNNFDEQDRSLDERTSPKIISDLSGVPILGMVPHVKGLDVKALEFSNLQDVMEKNVNVDAIFST